jgi:hypothetical protein
MPPVHCVFNGIRLGSWVNTQRPNHMRGKLSDERRGRLESLRRWSWEPHTDLWDRTFAALQQYAHRTGHANPLKAQRKPGSYSALGERPTSGIPARKTPLGPDETSGSAPRMGVGRKRGALVGEIRALTSAC